MSFNYMIKNNYTIYKNIIQYNKQYVVIKNVDFKGLTLTEFYMEAIKNMLAI